MDNHDIDITAIIIDALGLPKTCKFNSMHLVLLVEGGSSHMFGDPLAWGHPCDTIIDDIVRNNKDDNQGATNCRASIVLDPPVINLFAVNHAFDNTSMMARVDRGYLRVRPDSTVYYAFAASLKQSFPLNESNPASGRLMNDNDTVDTKEKESKDDSFGTPAPRDFLLNSPELEKYTTTVLWDQDKGVTMTSHHTLSQERARDSDDELSIE